MKRALLLLLVAAAPTCASTIAEAHASVGVYFGGPAYAAPPPVYYQPYASQGAYQSYPPPVVYQAPPVVYQAPPVVYQAPPIVYGQPPGAYGYGYQDRYRRDDWDNRGRRDNGWRRGNERRCHRDDEDC